MGAAVPVELVKVSTIKPVADCDTTTTTIDDPELVDAVTTGICRKGIVNSPLAVPAAVVTVPVWVIGDPSVSNHNDSIPNGQIAPLSVHVIMNCKYCWFVNALGICCHDPHVVPSALVRSIGTTLVQ